MHVPANRITAILAGERSVTAETALRLARYFGGNAGWWLRLQARYDEEAARDLVRAREDARGDLMRARHRLSKLLLRHGAVYDATAWTRAHDAWVRKQRFQDGPLAIVFDECYSRMIDAKTRRDTLDKAIAELAATPPYVDVVERLRVAAVEGRVRAGVVALPVVDERAFLRAAASGVTIVCNADMARA